MQPDPQQVLQTALGSRYRVDRLLGTGGTAAVYLAHDNRHDRQVAIKVLRPAVAFALGSERFLREIHIAANLNHPHILPLHDSGDADGMLYYVMPYVVGESVRERLVRERQIPMADALRIAHEVASALSYAHAHGVIHRDIKPENILLQDGYALVADFGLARALTEARDAHITQVGLVMGTPAYMSPEQASGSPTVDGRADIYALACVLYEMLSGAPPFPGENPAVVLARHISDPVPPLRTPQAVPREVVAAITRALAKRPEDRFQSASAFMEALEPRSPSHGWRRSRALTVPLTAMALVAVLGLVARNPASRARMMDWFQPALDSTAYLVLPVGGSSDSLAREAAAGVRTGLSRWRDVHLAAASDQPTRAWWGGDQNSPSAAINQAKALRAGWVVQVAVTPEQDSLHARAELVAVRDGRLVRGAAVTLPGGSALRAPMAEVAYRLLLDIPDAETMPADLLRTSSLKASREFQDALAHQERWELTPADSALAGALAADPRFGAAALHLAKLRAWRGQAPERWVALLDQAARAPGNPDGRSLDLARGLGAIASQEFGAPCDSLLAVARRPAASGDFDLWYTAGVCLEADRKVIPDPRSPSGWRFRASGHQAQLAFEHSFRLNPAFSADQDSPYRNLLHYTTAAFRSGSLGQKGLDFGAYPQLVADSLSLVPWPIRNIESDRAMVSARGRLEAVVWARERLRQLATAWLALRPGDPDALESLGTAMEMQNDPAACDTLHRARSLARSRDDAARLAATEAYVRLKEAFRAGRADFRKVRAVADTVLMLLGPDSLVGAPAAIAGVAALSGKAGLAVRLERHAAAAEFAGFPSMVRDVGVAYQVYAAMGGPRDSVLRYEPLVHSSMATQAATADLEDLRRNFLIRPAQMLFPDIDLDRLLAGYSGGDYLLDALDRLRRGDTTGALARVSEVVHRRWAGTRSASMDGVLPEVRLMMLSGRPAVAAAWLDSAFAALTTAPVKTIADPVKAGAIMQALALRADLAATLGNHQVAKEWAEAVLTLWNNPDPGYSQLVERMTQFARR